jgi:7-cyano-7-deazaguanine synthase
MKSICVLSGGLDSSVLLAFLLAQGRQVHSVSINYGQRHRKELSFARQLAASYGNPHHEVNISDLATHLPGSSQTDASVPVPHGHYEEESMKLTVVPNRNMILLAIAGAIAVAHKADSVAYAAHAGDHAIYPDCREEFVSALDSALQLADWHVTKIERPFISLTKAEIVKEGHLLGVPFSLTWSCYEGGQYHCGKCGTCVERREAFQLAGITDPVKYAI